MRYYNTIFIIIAFALGATAQTNATYKNLDVRNLARIRGAVGIGVTAPAERLEIDGNIAFEKGDTRFIFINENTPDGGNHLGISSGFGTVTGTSYSGNVYIFPQLADFPGNVLLNTDSDGNWTGGFTGIGVAVPSQMLEVAGKAKIHYLDTVSQGHPFVFWNENDSTLSVMDWNSVAQAEGFWLRNTSVMPGYEYLYMKNQGDDVKIDTGEMIIIGTHNGAQYGGLYWNYDSAAMYLPSNARIIQDVFTSNVFRVQGATQMTIRADTTEVHNALKLSDIDSKHQENLLGIDSNGNVTMMEDYPNHCFFDFVTTGNDTIGGSSPGVDIAISTQYVWTKSALGIADIESDGFILIAVDTIQYIGEAAHIRWECSISYTGGNGQDWEFGMFNVTDSQNAPIPTRSVRTTTGATNLQGANVLAYDVNASKNDKYCFKVRNHTNTDDLAVFYLTIYGYVVHYE